MERETNTVIENENRDKKIGLQRSNNYKSIDKNLIKAITIGEGKTTLNLQTNRGGYSLLFSL